MRVMGCELCEQDGGLVVLRTPALRVLRVSDSAFPGFYRLVWNDHVAEFSDLSQADRRRLMDAVNAAEQTLRQLLQPTKVNLASLGNVVPHLHWHVIARFDWDSHFPQPVWAAPLRKVDPPPVQRLPLALDRLDGAMATAVRVALESSSGTASP